MIHLVEMILLGVQKNVSGMFLWTKLINESSLRCMDNEVPSPRSSGVSSSDEASIEDKVRPLFCVTSILATSSTDSRFPPF